MDANTNTVSVSESATLSEPRSRVPNAVRIGAQYIVLAHETVKPMRRIVRRNGHKIRRIYFGLDGRITMQCAECRAVLTALDYSAVFGGIALFKCTKPETRFETESARNERETRESNARDMLRRSSYNSVLTRYTNAGFCDECGRNTTLIGNSCAKCSVQKPHERKPLTKRYINRNTLNPKRVPDLVTQRHLIPRFARVRNARDEIIMYRYLSIQTPKPSNISAVHGDTLEYYSAPCGETCTYRFGFIRADVDVMDATQTDIVYLFPCHCTECTRAA